MVAGNDGAGRGWVSEHVEHLMVCTQRMTELRRLSLSKRSGLIIRTREALQRWGNPGAW